MDQAYWLFAFDSPHAAIAAQKLLAGCGAVVMPTLRCITANCGMSLRLTDEAIEDAKRMMQGSAIDLKLYKLYRVEKRNGETLCTEQPIPE